MDLSSSNEHHQSIFIGCAGWSIPSAMQEHFPAHGTHLERYARVFPAVEINTSFYRPHLPATYERWRDCVPDAFRFAAKIPKAITHELRLQQTEDALNKFIDEVSHLRQKLGCLLVQLPPSLRYDRESVQQFFSLLRQLTNVAVACEARHPTWFTAEAAELLGRFEVDQVHADPQIAPLPGAPHKIAYIRLHGSPQIYHSPYSDAYLDELAGNIKTHVRSGRQVWTIFDNTASGAAVPNALSLLHRLQAR